MFAVAEPYSRLDFAIPAPVASTQMTLSGASGQVIHPSQHRCLSVREYARIQGFPDWYEFSKSKSDHEVGFCLWAHTYIPSSSYLSPRFNTPLVKTSSS